MPLVLLLFIVISLNANENIQLSEECRPSFSLENEAFPLTDLEGEPNAIVDNCVNVITGDFVDMQQDLFMPGSLPLIVNRSYCSSDRSKGSLSFGWHLNLGGIVAWMENGKNKIIGWKGPYGRELSFKKGKDDAFYLEDKILDRGVTNNSSGHISGKTNLKNLSIRKNREEKNYTILTGDGSQLFFTYDKKTDTIHDLTGEKKANGMGTEYEYCPNTGFLKDVTVVNKLNCPRQKIHFDYEELKNKDKDLRITITGNDLRQVRYTFMLGKYTVGQTKRFRHFLKEVERPDLPDEKYTYEKIEHFERVIRKDIGRNFTEVEYYKADKYGDIKVNKSHPWFNRIHTLKKPIGATESSEVAYTFQYHVPNGRKNAGVCAVYNAHHIKTDYCWNDQNRLIQVNRFNKHGSLYTQDILYWGENEEASLLKSRVYKCNEQILFCKSYTYDAFGNVTNSTLYGNITGLSQLPIIICDNGMPFENGTERYEKRFVYSQDGKNSLLEEIEGSRKKVYVYYPETNLLACEYTCFHDAIVIRRFFSYDNDCNLIMEITDNGYSTNPEDLVGVTLRKVKKITPTNTIPWGLPYIIEEFGIDVFGNQEILERMTVHFYDAGGKLIRKDHYGSDLAYCFSLYWEYDDRGNLIRETNPCGEITHREYDVNGNLISEICPEPAPIKKFEYDFSNRLVCEREYHNDITLSKHYMYNTLSQKIAEVDYYGNVTTFEYDDFGRLIKTSSPAMVNQYGETVVPTIERNYNGMGNLICKKDENGNFTHIDYTIRGQPCKVIYPDGTQEHFVYYFHGPLMAKSERNGCSTRYIRDYLDRVVRTEFYTPDGSLLWTKSAIYDAFNLIEETDALGYKTCYTYDHFGRKTKMKKEGLEETYEYDSFGRLIKQSTFYENQSAIIKIQAFDALDRVIEEREKDSNGNLNKFYRYAYDSLGHRVKIISYGENEAVQISEMRYNSHGLVAESIDPQGNMTKCRFIIERNSIGQIISGIETIDSLGRITIVLKDVYEREAICIRKNPIGQVIQKQEFFYDPVGNLCKTVETAFVGTAPTHQIVTFWIFDAMQRVTSLIEALGTPEQKRINYIYNATGQLAIIENPSGQKILHAYYPDGLLASYSSDHFHYLYQYDLNQRLINSYDLFSKRGFARKYDEIGNLVVEEQGDFTIRYNRDGIGRTKLIELPDRSKISYLYQGALLKKIARLSISGEEVYSHTYDCYDLLGNVIQETFLQQRISVRRSFDLNNRLSRSKSKYVEETYNYDSENNLLEKEINGEKTTYVYDSLDQLKEEQSTISHKYSYDSLYNRLSKNTDKYTINSLNQVLSTGNDSFTYSEDGNLTKYVSANASIDLSYDALGRLISSTKNGITTIYTYDSLNRRISKTQHDQTLYFIHDGQNEIGAIQNNKIVELRILGLGRGAEIGASIALELKDALYAPLHDSCGNVTALIGLNNEIVESYKYFAFGEELVSKNTKNPWRFCSKRFDEETGFVYFGNRYYMPSLGRWISCDPLGHKAGPNLYAYVCNSPLIYFDAYGLFQEKANIRYFDSYDESFFDGQRSEWYRYSLPEMNDKGIGFINGVYNSFSNLQENADYLMGLGAKNMFVVFNPYHGYAADPFECVLGMSGIATPPVRRLHDQWDHFFNNSSDDSIFFQICHSQGAIHVKNALQDYPDQLCQRIMVLAIAPADYIHPVWCNKVYHYRAEADRDCIPRINQKNAIGFEYAIIDLVSHPNAPSFDHNFNSPTYRKYIKQHIDEYLNP